MNIEGTQTLKFDGRQRYCNISNKLIGWNTYISIYILKQLR